MLALLLVQCCELPPQPLLVVHALYRALKIAPGELDRDVDALAPGRLAALVRVQVGLKWLLDRGQSLERLLDARSLGRVESHCVRLHFAAAGVRHRRTSLLG